MTKAKQSPSLTIDFSEVENGMTVIKSLAYAISKGKRLHDEAARVLYRRGEDKFYDFADATAAAGGEDGVEHMYEWGRAGNPNSRLFSMVWKGSRGDYKGNIEFRDASMKIPVPIPEGHQRAVDAANSDPDRNKEIVLSRFVWVNKAEQLETRSAFRITPQGNKARHNGWVRTTPGSHAPAKRLMVELGGEIAWLPQYTQTYKYQGKFTAAFSLFWSESNFKTVVFDEFEKNYYRAVGRAYVDGMQRSRITTPARIPRPGIHMVSNGRKNISRVGGKIDRSLAKRYEKMIRREMTSGRR